MWTVKVNSLLMVIIYIEFVFYFSQPVNKYSLFIWLQKIPMDEKRYKNQQEGKN